MKGKEEELQWLFANCLRRSAVKMPLSLDSSSDVARILAMTHKDFLDLGVMTTTSLILVDFQSNGAEILKVEIHKRESLLLKLVL